MLRLPSSTVSQQILSFLFKTDFLTNTNEFFIHAHVFLIFKMCAFSKFHNQPVLLFFWRSKIPFFWKKKQVKRFRYKSKRINNSYINRLKHVQFQAKFPLICTRKKSIEIEKGWAFSSARNLFHSKTEQ